MPYFYGAPEPKKIAGAGVSYLSKQTLEHLARAHGIVPKIKVCKPKRPILYGNSYRLDGFHTVRRRREAKAGYHQWS